MFSPEMKDWHQAEQFCVSHGGHLASVTTLQIFRQIWKWMGTETVENVWLGGSDLDSEETWRWTDGCPWDWTRWRSGEPNDRTNEIDEDCLKMVRIGVYSEGWNDESCSRNLSFFCSREQVPDAVESELPLLWDGQCVHDSGPISEKLLPHKENIRRENTPSVCIRYCKNRGFSFAGVQFRHECFCGNSTEAAKHKPCRDCNYPCPGHDSKICGGNDRMNVYSTDAGLAPIPYS